MKITTAKTSVTGNDIIGTKDKDLFYVVFGEGENKYAMNIGEKSYNKINELLNEEKERGSIEVDGKTAKLSENKK